MELFEHFRKWQAIYAVGLALVVQFVMYGDRIARLEIQYEKSVLKIEDNSMKSAEINSRLASIETSLEFIKSQLK